MTVFRDLDGTLNYSFTIGLGGPTIWQGGAAPNDSTGQDGDLFVVQSYFGGVYKKILGAWGPIEQAPEVSQQQTERGINITVSVNDTVVAVIHNPYTIDSTTTTIDSEIVTIDNDAATTTTITLVDGQEGEEVVIMDQTGIAATCPIIVNAVIDNASSVTISTNYGVLDLIYSGGEWRTVGV